MSLNNTETPLLHRFWKETGGTLIEEFVAVRKGPEQEIRRIDGVVIKGGDFAIKAQDEVVIAGQDIVVVQVKSGRLGMYLMGQALFSRMVMEEFKPRNVESVAVCRRDDVKLTPLLEQFEGCRVVVYEDRYSRRQGGR